MKTNRLLFAIFILSALFLSACSGSGRLTASSWPGVTVTEDQVFVAYAQHVYSLNTDNGRRMWQYPVEPDNNISFFAAPQLTEDASQLIVGGYDKILYSLNPDNGSSAGWSFDEASNRYIGAPLVTSDAIYAPNSDGNLYAVDFTGNSLWNQAYNTVEPQWSSPTTDGNLVYIAALDHHIHAINPETGTAVWTQDIETASTGSPLIEDGVLYAGTFGNKLFAINAETGRVLWQFETSDWVWGTPAVSNGLLVVGDISGLVYGVETSSGRETWRFTANGGVYGGVLAVEDTFYFGTDAGEVYGLKADSDIDLFFNTTGKIYNQPVYNGEYLFIATIEGENLITAIDLNGNSKWSFTPEN